MQHKVKLTNGQTVVLEEQSGALSIGQLDSDDVDWWICTISGDGVLVAPNSSYAPEELTRGLEEDARPARHEVWIKFGDELDQRAPDHFVFETIDELNAFLKGVLLGSREGELPFSQFDSQQEVQAYLAGQATSDSDD